MNALVPVFVAILLAEMGGKVQGFSALMTRQGRGVSHILLTLGITALLLFAVAAVAGVLMAGIMPPDGRRLFFALSLLFAGVPMLWTRPVEASAETGQGLQAIPRIVIQMATDGAPFIILAAAAYTASPALVVSAGTVAVLVAALFPAVMGAAWPGTIPLRALRIVAAVLLIAAAWWQAINALRII